MILSRIHIISFLAVLVLGCGTKENIVTTPERPAPEWVNARPINPSYYIGIGSVSKITEPMDYAAVAKKNALNDLASEISVIVKSESFLNTMQVNSQVQEEFNSTIATFSDEKIEGFELVDAWENDRDYFIYYRLSKAKHAQIREEKKRAVMQSAYDYLTQAREAALAANIHLATDLYLRGLFEMKEYWNDVNQWDDQGSIIYLDNTLYQEMKSMLNSVELLASETEIELNAGNKFKDEMNVLVTSNGNPLSGLQLEYKYDNGKFRNTYQAKTDLAGTIRVNIHDANLNNGNNQVEVALDKEDLKPSDMDKKLLDPLFESVRAQTVVVPIRTIKPRILIMAEEKNLGTVLGTQRIADPLREKLREQGFVFASSTGDADYIIELSADTKQGGTSQGFHVSYLEMNYTLKDEDGNVLLQNSESNIKGLQLNFEAAGLEAYKKAERRMEREIADDLIEAMF